MRFHLFFICFSSVGLFNALNIISWCFYMLKKPIHCVDYTISPLCIFKTGFLSKCTYCNAILLQNGFLFVHWNFTQRLDSALWKTKPTMQNFVPVLCRCRTAFYALVLVNWHEFVFAALHVNKLCISMSNVSGKYKIDIG